MSVPYTKLYLSNGLAYDFEGAIDAKEGEVIHYLFEREENWGRTYQSISDVEIVGKDDTAKFTKHEDYKLINVEYTDKEK